MGDGWIKIAFNIAGEAQFSRKLKNIGNAVTDLTPAWQDIAWDFYQTEAEFFQSAGDGNWKPLKDSYADWKRSKGLSPRILVATGALEASLTRPGAPGAVCVMSPLALTLGTLVRTKNGKFNLGLIHQEPTRIERKREVIRFSDAQKLRWSKFLSRCAQKQIKEARDGKLF